MKFSLTNSLRIARRPQEEAYSIHFELCGFDFRSSIGRMKKLGHRWSMQCGIVHISAWIPMKDRFLPRVKCASPIVFHLERTSTNDLFGAAKTFPIGESLKSSWSMDGERSCRATMIRNTVTEYERIGECNQCGQCCVIAEQIRWFAWKPTLPDTVENLGSCLSGFKRMFRVKDGSPLWYEVVAEDGTRRYYEPHYLAPGPNEDRTVGCRAFVDGHCTVQETKHQVSKDWPYAPSQTDIPFSQCSFRFVSLGQRKIKLEEEPKGYPCSLSTPARSPKR